MILFSAGAYDADEPEGSERPGSQYISRKDLKWLGVVFVILFAFSVPLYMHFLKQTQRSVCARNFKAMFDAINLYAQEYDGRFPPAMVETTPNSPLLIAGKPFTWASVIQRFMDPKRSFSCPSATDAENVRALHPDSNTTAVEMSYGLYWPMSVMSSDRVANPSETALILETSNRGAEGTFDPLPLKLEDGSISPYDGFVVGFEKSNGPSPDVESKWVTRLAFRGTGDGSFDEKDVARHESGLHVLFVSGSLGTLAPTSARLKRLGERVEGLWSTR